MQSQIYVRVRQHDKSRMLIVASIPAEAGSVFKQRFRLFLLQRAAEPAAEATGWVPNFRIAFGSYFVVENKQLANNRNTSCEPESNKNIAICTNVFAKSISHFLDNFNL